jgi:GNAT superfamily N-acetyltransferase
VDFIGENLSFRPAEPEDIDTLWSLNLAPPVDRARILWLHFDNPFREGRPPIWVLEHRDWGVVGKLVNIYCPLRIDGVETRACYSADLHLDPRLRGSGLGKRIVGQQFETFTAGPVLGSSANGNSVAMWTKHGGGNVPGGDQRFQSYVTSRGLLSVAANALPFARSVLASWIAHATDPRAPGSLRGGSEGSDWQSVSAHDPDLQDFLDPIERTAGVTTRRSPEYLEWRYAQCPSERPEMLVVRDGGKIVGFFAIQVRPRSTVFGAWVAEILDWMAPLDDLAALRRVAAASRDWAVTRGADLVEWRGTHPVLSEIFGGTHWIRRKSPNPFVIYGRDWDGERIRTSTWHLVPGDGDLCLV